MRVRLNDETAATKENNPIVIKSDSMLDISMPNIIKAEYMALKIKSKIIELFVIEENMYKDLNINKIIVDFDKYMTPIITKYTLDSLSLVVLATKDISNCLIDIIYNYIKLEYYMHSLVFKDKAIKEHITKSVTEVIENKV